MDFASIPERLKGRFALVTGGSRGIGRAIAERFCAEGATVAVNYSGHREAAEETLQRLGAIDAERGRMAAAHMAVKADVSDSAAIEAMFAETLNRFGRLDILVNNAGIQSPSDSDAFDDADMAKIIGVNLTGVALCCRAALRHFRSRPGGGVILNNTSVHQLIPKPQFLAYAMSKGGLGQLTRTLALEFADKRIRVNAVAPGAIVTDINAAWKDDPEARRKVEAHIPMGYAAEPEAVASVFAFLASDEASYVTGQTIFVDGGLTLFADFKQNWSS